MHLDKYLYKIVEIFKALRLLFNQLMWHSIFWNLPALEPHSALSGA